MQGVQGKNEGSKLLVHNLLVGYSVNIHYARLELERGDWKAYVLITTLRQ